MIANLSLQHLSKPPARRVGKSHSGSVRAVLLPTIVMKAIGVLLGGIYLGY
jgi:hypothetical protein